MKTPFCRSSSSKRPWIREALELFFNRYAKLSAEQGDKFSDSPDEYWAGSYS